MSTLPTLSVSGKLELVVYPNHSNELPPRSNDHKLTHTVGSLQNSDCYVNSFVMVVYQNFYIIL